MKNVRRLILIGLIVMLIMTAMAGMIYAAPVNAQNNFPGGSTPDAAAGQIQEKVYKSLAGPALTLGGLAAFLGVVMCGFEMIFSKFNPDKRGGAMTSLLWVGGGLMVIGLAGIIAGFLLNMAKTV